MKQRKTVGFSMHFFVFLQLLINSLSNIVLWDGFAMAASKTVMKVE